MWKIPVVHKMYLATEQILFLKQFEHFNLANCWQNDVSLAGRKKCMAFREWKLPFIY